MKKLFILLAAAMSKHANAVTLMAAMGAVSSEWLGLAMPPLVWASVGALTAVLYAAPPPPDQTGRAVARGVLGFFLGTASGALLGTTAAQYLGVGDMLYLYLACLVCGHGANRVLAAMLDTVLQRVPATVDRVLEKYLPK